MAAGVSLAGKPDVGDSIWRPGAVSFTYGVLLHLLLEVEGINIRALTIRHRRYFDSYSLAEAEFKTVRIMRMSELLAFTWSRP